MSLPELPTPDVLHELHDAPCPACNTMLRTLPPIKLGYTGAQMQAYADKAVDAYRQKLRAEFAKRHAEIKHHHNYYWCLVREIDDGVL